MMEMAKIAMVTMLWCLIQFEILAQTHATETWATTTQVSNNWQEEKLGLGSEKVTHLHFYFHDTGSGKTPSSVMVAKANTTYKSQTFFGTVMMADDPLTQGPEPTSKLVGQAQRIYGSADQQETGLIMAMTFGFVDNKYNNGSTLSILGRNQVLTPVREMPVVRGSGVFRYARGVAIARTYSFNISNGDAIVEYNVTAIHY